MIEPGPQARPEPLDEPGLLAQPRAGGRGPLRVALAGFAVLVLAVGAVVFAINLRGADDDQGAAPLPLPSMTTATASPTPTTDDPEQVRAAALESLLAARSRAVLSGDEAAWLATVDPEQTGFHTRQAAQFANLAKLPLTRWQYQVVGAGGDLSAARQAALGPDAWIARVDLGYRFGAADRTDVHSSQYLTLVQRAGRWLLASDRDGKTSTEIWDLGPLTVVRGKSSVVIGLGSAASLKGYVSQADSAVTRVTAIWGSAWPRRVVMLVPGTQAQMGRLLDRSSDSLSQIAAVTTGELTAAAGAPAGGADQIIVNPAGFARLGSLGRRVVITHEATHVAVRASTPRQVSLWLSEGFADYVGYSGLDLPRTEVADDVLGLVRRGTGPKALPDAEAFDATRSTIGPAYSASWLACELIADRYGQAKLLAFYRAVAGATTLRGIPAADSADAATAAAFRAVLGLSQPAFTRVWLSYLTDLSRQ